MLELKNINISFDNKECIRNGNFKAYPYRITGIYGESGTGKSSLLYIIGMLSNQKYEYYYNNELLNYNDKQKAKFRNEHISFITQNSLLIETITVEKNIEFFLTLSNTDYTADNLLELVNLTDKKDAMPNSLSGGERQRAAIACAIAKDSDIILGDELTSALDEDNKKIVMKLLRECANQGKIVILVSHEKKVLDECDRLYKIDHLELILETAVIEEIINTNHINISKKKNIFKTFKLLFNSNKKMKRRRLIISFMVMLILFMSASIVDESKSQYSDVNYSLENVSNRKIIIINDHAELKQDSEYYSTQRDLPGYYDEPFFQEDLDKIYEIDHIEKIYDCFVFHTSQQPTSHRHLDTSIIATRNGKQVEKRDYINGYDYSVVPIYPEEEIYTKDGVYVSTFFAYIYNLQVGDELDMEIEIPYAMTKTISKGTFREDESGQPYYSYDKGGFTESIHHKTKVVGIIEGNSLDAMEVYMDYDLMETFLYDMIEKRNVTNFGEIIEDSIPLMEVAPFQSYSKVIFVDEYENVLEVQNQINDISKRLYAYNEYQTVSSVMEMMKGYMDEAVKMALAGVSIFIVGAGIVEVLYLMKYKSVYMMLKLNGYDIKKILSLYVSHAVFQLFMMLLMSMFIYVSASFPDILYTLKLMSYDQIWTNMSQFYNTYYVYCAFSIDHFVLFASFLLLVILIINILVIRHYNKLNITKWIRGG